MPMYLKELPNGNRVTVDHNEYMVDSFKREFMTIINTSTVLIYRLAGVKSRPVERTYRYGGRRSHIVGDGYAGN